jgi:hypothetical protein
MGRVVHVKEVLWLEIKRRSAAFHVERHRAMFVRDHPSLPYGSKRSHTTTYRSSCHLYSFR